MVSRCTVAAPLLVAEAGSVDVRIANTLGPQQEQRRALILVGVHGNEGCGVHAVNELGRTFFEAACGAGQAYTEVRIVLGNPRAFLLNQRFVDANLNRLFEGETVAATTYENERMQVLSAAIEEADAVLDLHSTSAVSQPFAIPAFNAASYSAVRNFDVEFIIEDLEDVIRGTTMHCVTESSRRRTGRVFHADEDCHVAETRESCPSTGDKVGITVECGAHNDRSSVDVAKSAIRTFLAGRQHGQSKARHVLCCHDSVPVRRGFQFVKTFEAFSKVDPGELIAKDETGDIHAPTALDHYYLIMPTALPVLGEEAWFWGCELSEDSSEHRHTNK